MVNQFKFSDLPFYLDFIDLKEFFVLFNIYQETEDRVQKYLDFYRKKNDIKNYNRICYSVFLQKNPDFPFKHLHAWDLKYELMQADKEDWKSIISFWQPNYGHPPGWVELIKKQATEMINGSYF